MFNSRYVVISQESQWRIVQGGRRFPETYPRKTQAICDAISLAERDGHAGLRAEDGHFVTEWVYGQDLHPEKTRPPVLPRNHPTQ
jgi:hypothetical protein